MFDRPFDRDEYLARVARVREEMARLGLDGLLLTSGPNLTYLSGYPSPLRAGSRPFIFLLPQSGTPILIVHTGREREARGYSWVEEIRTYHALSRAPLPEIIEAFQDAGLMQGRLGPSWERRSRSMCRLAISWSCGGSSPRCASRMLALPCGRRGCASLPRRSTVCGRPARRRPAPMR